MLCLAPATPTYGFQLATTPHSTTPTHAPTPTKPVPCRPYTALHVFRPCSTAERAGSGAWTRRRATMTGSAQMAYQSCRQRASAGATASPTSPSCSRGRASSSSIARSVRAPAACRDAPPRSPPCDPPPRRSSLTQLLLPPSRLATFPRRRARSPSPTPRPYRMCTTVHR